MINDILETAVQAINEAIEQHGAEVTGADLGLDPRALHRGHIVDDVLIVRKSADRNLQYYGGFEYVEDAARTTIGDYVIYAREGDERINEAFECFEEKQP